MNRIEERCFRLAAGRQALRLLPPTCPLIYGQVLQGLLSPLDGLLVIHLGEPALDDLNDLFCLTGRGNIKF